MEHWAKLKVKKYIFTKPADKNVCAIKGAIPKKSIILSHAP